MDSESSNEFGETRLKVDLCFEGNLGCVLGLNNSSNAGNLSSAVVLLSGESERTFSDALVSVGVENETSDA